MKEPVHDTMSFNLGGCRVLVFGGHVNNQPNATFDIYDLTCETLQNLEPLEPGKNYMPPVLDMTSGYLHYYVGYGDTMPKHSRLQIGSLICQCQGRTGFSRNVIPTNPVQNMDASFSSARSPMVSRSKTEMQARRQAT